MRKLLSFILMLILVTTTFLISGCLPPNYTKEKAKEIVKNHKQEALAWFPKNMPTAKPDSDCEAYEMGSNLLGALKGTYKKDGKNYAYVYEYTNKKMYISEGYKETCDIVKKAILKDFGYTEQESEVSFHGYSFLGKNENDDPKPRFKTDNDGKEVKEFYSNQEKMIPADMTPEQFAKAILNPDTKENFAFYLHLYRDEFPAQQLEKQKLYKNLRSIWCSIKIDLTKQPQGVYERVYLTNKIEDRYYHIEKITDDLYGGYYAVKGKPADDDKFKINYQKNKHLTLKIPKGTRPIIFSKNSLNLVHYFKNTKGELIQNEAEELYRSKQAEVKGYHQYSTSLFVKDDFSYAYSNIMVPLVEGVYNYKILSVFDLDYWMLKFFN